MKPNIKRYAAWGIAVEVLYFISLALFLIIKGEAALTFWEVMTVVGGAAMLIVMTAIAGNFGVKGMCRTLLNVSLSGTVFLTSAAHFVNIGVIRRLAAQGENVPEYFKIGVFPSVEMTLDYTAWGLFMGCAFLMLSAGADNKVIRRMSAVCSALCFTGFIGSFFSEGLWYFAPMGYGVGFMLMCMYLRRDKKKQC